MLEAVLARLLSSRPKPRSYDCLGVSNLTRGSLAYSTISDTLEASPQLQQCRSSIFSVPVNWLGVQRSHSLGPFTPLAGRSGRWRAFCSAAFLAVRESGHLLVVVRGPHCACELHSKTAGTNNSSMHLRFCSFLTLCVSSCHISYSINNLRMGVLCLYVVILVPVGRPSSGLPSQGLDPYLYLQYEVYSGPGSLMRRQTRFVAWWGEGRTKYYEVRWKRKER